MRVCCYVAIDAPAQRGTAEAVALVRALTRDPDASTAAAGATGASTSTNSTVSAISPAAGKATVSVTATTSQASGPVAVGMGRVTHINPGFWYTLPTALPPSISTLHVNPVSLDVTLSASTGGADASGTAGNGGQKNDAPDQPDLSVLALGMLASCCTRPLRIRFDSSLQHVQQQVGQVQQGLRLLQPMAPGKVVIDV